MIEDNRIVIAEDDVTSRLILDKVLRNEGYQVLSFTNGEEALAALLLENSPRLAVLDWMLPEMDGVQVCSAIRKREDIDQPYILILTALNQKEQMLEGLAGGADDYLTKPFDREELLARIRVGERVVALQTSLRQRVIELENAMDHIKRLQGTIPICMYCHKIRTDKEAWDKLEQYIEENSEAHFSHSICPQCMEEKYPEED